MPAKKRAAPKRSDLAIVRSMLEEIRAGQQELLRQNKSLLGEERKIERQEERSAVKEERELSDLDKLEHLENQLAEDVRVKPLAKITRHDFSRAVVGAFFGVVGHFAFFYSTEIAELEHFTMARASALFGVSLVLAVVFLYFTGFRKVDKAALKYMPLRVLVLYVTSIAVVVFVLMIFGFINEQTSFDHVYKTIASTSLLAVLGAAAADLIGREA
jgi:uncharacterized membrane protein